MDCLLYIAKNWYHIVKGIINISEERKHNCPEKRNLLPVEKRLRNGINRMGYITVRFLQVTKRVMI